MKLVWLEGETHFQGCMGKKGEEGYVKFNLKYKKQTESLTKSS